MVLHADDAAVADRDDRQVAADLEVAAALQRPLVVRVALVAGGAEADDDLVLGADAAVELDAVALAEALLEDAEHVVEVGDRRAVAADPVPLHLRVEQLPDRL